MKVSKESWGTVKKIKMCFPETGLGHERILFLKSCRKDVSDIERLWKWMRNLKFRISRSTQNRLNIQIQSHFISDPPFSDIDFKNKMAWVRTALRKIARNPSDSSPGKLKFWKNNLKFPGFANKGSTWCRNILKSFYLNLSENILTIRIDIRSGRNLWHTSPRVFPLGDVQILGTIIKPRKIFQPDKIIRNRITLEEKSTK